MFAYPPAKSAEEVQSYKDEEFHNLVKVDDGGLSAGDDLEDFDLVAFFERVIGPFGAM